MQPGRQALCDMANENSARKICKCIYAWIDRLSASATSPQPLITAMLSAAVEPILEAISIGRTDIIKKLVEEVEAEIKKSNKFENDQERGKGE